MASSAPDHLRTPGLISNRPCYEGINFDPRGLFEDFEHGEAFRPYDVRLGCIGFCCGLSHLADRFGISHRASSG